MICFAYFLVFHCFCCPSQASQSRLAMLEKLEKRPLSTAKFSSQGERKKILQCVQIHFCNAALRRRLGNRIGKTSTWQTHENGKRYFELFLFVQNLSLISSRRGGTPNHMIAYENTFIISYRNTFILLPQGRCFDLN